MSYSVDESTQIATLDGVQYYPNCISDGVTMVFVALTEAECQSKKAEADAVPAFNLEILRKIRNEKLAETDWEIVKHKELGTNVPTALKTYRQALRDITDNYTSLDDVVWPTKP